MSLGFRFSAYVTLLTLNVLLLALLHQTWPIVGSDLWYFLPRLIDVHLHYLCNGLTLQWWTPSFGGGLPAFPNPLHTQFMLAQFILPFTDPWTAHVLSFLLPLSLGYLLVLKFCSEYLSWSPGAAIITAAIFATDNFDIDHGFRGHISYALFPMLAVLPFCLHARLHRLSCISVLALVGTAIVFSGGYQILVPYALTALLLTFGLALYDRTMFAPGRSFTVLAGGAALTVMATAAKVCAVTLFLRQFPREVNDAIERDWLNTWLSVPGRLFLPKAPFMIPLLHRVFGLDIGTVPAWWATTDLGLSPVVLLLVPVGLVGWIGHWSSPAKIWLSLALCFDIWITIELASEHGVLWPYLKALPILHSMHVAARFGSAFILPLALLAGLGMQILLRSFSPRLGFVLVAFGVIVTLTSLLQYSYQMARINWALFDISEVQRVWTLIQKGERGRPIATISDVRDDQGFALHSSNWKPYEPIFGAGRHGGPNFRTQLHPGPILPSHKGGSVNFNFPLAFYAPGLAGQEAFTPLPADRVADLNVLLDRRQPGWPLPPVQTVANIVSLFGLAGIAGGLWSSRCLDRRKHFSLPPD